MSQKITVATANTYLGNMLREPDGLKNVVVADILLLQEVVGVGESALNDILQSHGYTELFFNKAFGLVIAVKQSPHLHVVKGSQRERRIGTLSLLEMLLAKNWMMKRNEFGQRGCIAITLKLRDNKELVIVNVHPSIDTPAWYRAKQIRRLSSELEHEYYADTGRMIIGGDMNHRPLPKEVDHDLIARHSLARVDLNGDHTWKIRGSQFEKPARLFAFLTRKPLDDYNFEMDTFLFSEAGVKPINVDVVDIPSDHRAIVAHVRIS